MTQKKLGKLINVYTRGDMQPNDKNRYFFIRTYLPKDAIEEFVNVTSAYAFIEHNAEECEKHFHLLCKFDNARTLLSVGKMCFSLSKKYAVCDVEQSTFVEIPTNKSTAFDYLTHSDSKSKKQGKHQYSISEVECDNVGAFKDESTIQETTSAVDILDDINKGVSFREMAQKYGKGFVTQYSKYKDYATAMSIEENAKKAPCTDDVFQALADYQYKQIGAVQLLTKIIDLVAFDNNRYFHKSVRAITDEYAFETFLKSALDVYRRASAEYKGYVLDSVSIPVLENLDSDEVCSK